jgi:hypothetical protein
MTDSRTELRFANKMHGQIQTINRLHSLKSNLKRNLVLLSLTLANDR